MNVTVAGASGGRENAREGGGRDRVTEGEGLGRWKGAGVKGEPERGGMRARGGP